MADWQSIKTEYITTDTSYRKLAQKYGIDSAVIGRRAKNEEWVNLRQQYIDKTQTKTIDAISNQQVDRAKKMQRVADKLLNKIEAMVECPEVMPRDIRALVAAVRDLKEIQNIRSDLDEQEQRARIANLHKQANQDKQGDAPKLVVEGLPEEFKV